MRRMGLSVWERKAVGRALHSVRDVRTTWKGRPEKRSGEWQRIGGGEGEGRKKRGKRGKKKEKEKERGREDTLARVGDRDIQGRSQFSRQCTRQPARRVCTLHGVFRELHRRARREGTQGTRDNEKCTRHDILLARPSYNCRAGSISPLPPSPSLSLSLSL